MMFGYRVHEGLDKEDPSLCGKFWWSLCINGMGDPEVSFGEFDSASEAWEDAWKHYREEFSS